MSISKAQATALADGFLDGLGSSKDEFQPRNTISELFLIIGEMLEDAKDNLKKSGAVSTGHLSASLIAGDPEQRGNIISVDLLMDYYGLFVNAGVKGLKSGKSTAGYSFKTPLPSEAMVKALAAGIGHAKQKTSSNTVKKYGAHGRHEKKSVDLATKNAFGAGVNIKKYGIKATGFLDKALIAGSKKIADRLGAALQVDILTALQL